MIGSIENTGQVNDMAVSGSYAYVAAGSSFYIIDISNPSQTFVAGSVAMQQYANANSVYINNNYAYVTDDYYGLLVIDIMDPVQPQIVGRGDTPIGIGAYDVSVSGTYAYIVAYYYGLQVFDIADPVNPHLVASIVTPDFARDLVVSGKYVCVAASSAGLLIIDITNPLNPNIVGSLDANISNLAAAADKYVYIVNADGCHVVDISNPLQPNIVSSVDTPGDKIFVLGEWVYVSQQSLYVLDISNPYLPSIKGEVNGLRAVGVDESGYIVFVAGYSGLQVYDITNYQSTPIDGNVDTTGPVMDVAVSGNYAYVADGNIGLLIVDLSCSQSPYIIGSAETTGFARHVAVTQRHALITYEYYQDGEYMGVHLVDITNPENPQMTSSVKTQGYTQGIAVSGNYAFIAEGIATDEGDIGYSGIEVADISDPQYPQIISKRPSGPVYDIEVSGAYAYIVQWYFGLQVIDISDPANLRVVGSVRTPGHACGVSILGDYAYVADLDAGLQVIDITNPAIPRIVGNVEIWAQEVAVSGTSAYILGEGLKVYSISNPDSPQYIGGLNIAGSCITIAEQHVFLGSESDGLMVMPSQCEPSVQNMLTLFIAIVEEYLPGPPIQPGLPGSPPSMCRAVALSWTLSEHIAPEALCLTASAGGATWDVPFTLDPSNPGGWSYTARDEAPQLASVLQARYTLLHAPSTGDWTALAERTVTFNTQGIPGARVPSLDVYPNPFNPRAMISYDLPRPGEVTVAVYDMRGRVVRSLWSGTLEVGRHQVEWDGRNERGDTAPTGVYLVRLITDEGVVRLQKMTLAR